MGYSGLRRMPAWIEIRVMPDAGEDVEDLAALGGGV